MADTIFSIMWCGLMVWTCLIPDGNGPYVLLGFNAGDFVVTLFCGVRYGYLKEYDDFSLRSFLTHALGFGLLGGFYAGNLSFQPGSDEYNFGVYLIFAAFLIAFGYRFFQYGVRHVSNDTC